MRNVLQFSISLILASSSMVIACRDDPNFTYDEMGSQDIAIVTAFVSDVQIVASKPSCIRASYTNPQYLYGVGEDAFSVTTCSADIALLLSLIHI